jgi:F-type H+-transporting ATPase subunit epsilon
MADLLQFELISPERRLLSQSAELVTLPGQEGYLGIMAGHAPLVVALQAGIIAIQQEGKVTQRLFVAGGFAEVTPLQLIILAQEVEPFANLDKAALEAEAASLREDIDDSGKDGKDGAQHAYLTERLEVVTRKLSLLAAPPI